MKVDLVQPNTKKKKKKSILIKIKPKERKDMVVLQIYILGFPIDLKKKKEFHKTVILLSGICRGFLWNEISLVNVTHRRAVLNLGVRDEHVSS